MREAPSRRAVLAATGALALTGCLPADTAGPSRPDPDLRLRRRVAREVRRLAAGYAAVIAAFPATATQLGPLAAEHQSHVAALEGPARSPGAAGSPTGPRSASPSPTPAPNLPATRVQAVAWLATQERAAATRRAAECLEAGPDLARLLASIGACEAVHAALLGGRL